MDCLTGIHAVKEALEAQRPIDRIAIAKGRQDTRVEEIVQLARKQGVPVRFEDRGHEVRHESAGGAIFGGGHRLRKLLSVPDSILAD